MCFGVSEIVTVDLGITDVVTSLTPSEDVSTGLGEITEDVSIGLGELTEDVSTGLGELTAGLTGDLGV
jgi:hypothetical protein